MDISEMGLGMGKTWCVHTLTIDRSRSLYMTFMLCALLFIINIRVTTNGLCSLLSARG